MEDSGNEGWTTFTMDVKRERVLHRDIRSVHAFRLISINSRSCIDVASAGHMTNPNDLKTRAQSLGIGPNTC